MHRTVLRYALTGSLLGFFLNGRAQTTLVPGDVAVVGINASNGGCGAWPATSDEFTFIILKDIVNATTIDITDNGFERQFVNQWGDTEGLFRLTRTGGALAKGTPITVWVNGSTNAITASAGWSVNTAIATPSPVTGTFNLNSLGDQIFFTQGGAWTNPNATNHNMTFSGTVLYAFNTKTVWTSLANTTGDSGLPPGSLCFSSAPLSASDWVKFVPGEYPTYITRTARQWIAEFDNPSRWTNYANCTSYNSTGPNYASGSFGSAPYTVVPMTTPVPVPGRWTGYYDSDWFSCRNWDDVTVPGPATPVTISPLYAPANNCVIGVTASPPTAQCASVTVSTAGIARTLTIQNAGVLQVGGTVTVTNTGAISAFNGVTLGNVTTDGNLTANGLVLSGNGVYKGGFRSEQTGNTVAINGNVTINAGGYLDLQGGASGGTMSLTGNYTNNDAATAYDEIGSYMVFNGSGPQSINTSGFQEDFAFLTVNKGSNDLTLNAPASVRSTLTMTSGRIMTSDPTGLLTLTNTANIFGANDAAPSFVHGPMVKVGNSPFTFPIGKGTRLHPASVTNVTGGATDSFIGEYFAADPNVDIGTPIETPPLDHISSCEYWRVDQYSGTPLGRVTLSWKAPMSCGVTNLPDLRVAHWDGSMWKDRGNGGASGTTLIGTIPQAASQETTFAPGGYWTLASVSIDNPLPIELLWFDARPDGSQVRLDWSTASERDNDYFTIERSADGHEFTEVMRVDGAGNSTTTLTYSDYDRWPLPGTSFYRLRQTDLDGATAVSNMVVVKMPGKGGNGLVVLNDADRIIALHDLAAGSRMEVLDMTGRLVWQGRTDMEGRSYVPLAELSTGAYVLRVSDDVRSESAPFVR